MSPYFHLKWCPYCKEQRVHDAGICLVCKSKPIEKPPDKEKSIPSSS